MQWQGAGDFSPAGPPQYREWTIRITIFALALGMVATVTSVYSGLKIANVVGAGVIAVTLGMIFKALPGRWRGTILEINMGQIMASNISSSAAGIIFTIPALYIMFKPAELALHHDFSFLNICIATVAGAVMGAAAIVPLRRRWIDIERLPFPGGSAMVPVVRVLGIPRASIITLLVAAVGAALLEVLKNTGFVPEIVPIWEWLGLPAYTKAGLQISTILLAAGLLAGKGGLPYLIGGVVAYLVLSPLAANFLITPQWAADVGAEGGVLSPQALSDGLYGTGLRPIGIGMFIGAALVSALLAAPVLRNVFRSMRGVRSGKGEIPLVVVGLIVLIGSATLYFVAQQSLPWWRSLLVVLVGVIYIVIANMANTECSARAAQQPVSGLSFVGAIVTYFLSDGNVVVAVFLGAAICSAITQGGDTMDDLLTASRVGADTRRAQLSQLAVSWIGPIVAMITVVGLAKAVGFGPDSEACKQKLATCLIAPQATALAAIMRGLSGGDFAYYLYGGGAILGGLFTLLPIGGAGVLFAIAFYLPFWMILSYGVGSFTRMGLDRVMSTAWINRYVLPAAGGFLLGESVVGITFVLVNAV